MATSVEAEAFGQGRGDVTSSYTDNQATAPGAPGNANATESHHRWDYGGNPLARGWTNESQAQAANAAFLQPGLFKVVNPKVANGAPLGLSGFAFTTFLLSMINLGVRGVATPNIVVGPAMAYGGLIQLLAGMWEMAAGNTFAAWALSSYGGFWISLGITFTPGLFDIASAYGGMTSEFYTALGFYLYGWFIFTILVWLATLRATLLFNLLLLFVWLTFLTLATAYIDNSGGVPAKPNAKLNLAGGVFGILAAFIAWWIMLAGCLDQGNSFFQVPTFPFPWAEEPMRKRRERRDDEEKQA